MRGARRWTAAGLLAAGCALVLHGRVPAGFDRVRLHVVRTPIEAASGTVTVPLPDLSALAGQPAAVVLRLASDGPAPRVVRVSAGGDLLADVALDPGRRTRVDLSVPDAAQLSAAGRLDLASAGGGWRLAELEVSNAHGFSRGLISFVVAPRAAAAAAGAGAAAGVAAFVVLAPLFAGAIRAARAARPPVRTALLAAAAPTLALLAAVLLAPAASDYAVLLAPHSFVFCVALLICPVLPAGIAAAARKVGRTSGRAAAADGERDGVDPRCALLYAGLITVFVVAIVRLHDPAAGYTSLVRFGAAFEQRTHPALRDVPRLVFLDSFGYDGQYYAQLAVDPLLRDPATAAALDAPAYRARRILLPAAAFLSGLGQPRFVVQAYAIQNAVCWLALALLLLRWFPPRNAENVWRAAGCLFAFGSVQSVTWALPAVPSLLLLALAVLAVEQGRPGRAAGVMALAGLARETNLLWSVVLLDPAAAGRGRARRLRRYGLAAAGPLAVWIGYLWTTGVDFSEFVGRRDNFAVPLTGFAAAGRGAASAVREDGWTSGPVLYLCILASLATQAAVLLAVRKTGDPWWRAGVAALTLAAVLGPALWEGRPPAAARILLPMTFAFNVVLPRRGRWRWPLLVLGNLTAAHGVLSLPAGWTDGSLPVRW